MRTKDQMLKPGLLACLLVAGLGVAVIAAAPASPSPQGKAKAIFAGGCFWCMEPAFDKIPGVISTTSGYTGGQQKNPTYREVSSGGTGHAESVQVLYDPAKVSYEQLLEAFWHNIDPLTRNAQFCDHGTQYRSAIFYLDEEQHRLAEKSLKDLQASGRFKQPIVTEIVAASQFYPAEPEHQDYYIINPIPYRMYRMNCGRDQRLKELWGTAPSH